MNKEEILARSREENKNQDLFEQEVSRDVGNIAAVVAGGLATLFFVIQIFVGGGMNYGLYAIVFSIPATGYSLKASRLKQRKDIILAMIYTIATLIFSIIHVDYLISTSNIL